MVMNTAEERIIVGTYSHFILANDPTLHSYALAIDSAVEVTMIIWHIELKTNIIAIPVRIIAVGVIFLKMDIASRMPVGIRENRKAFPIPPDNPGIGIKAIPHIM